MSSIDSFTREFEIVETFKETGQKKVCLCRHPKLGKVVLKTGKSASAQRVKESKTGNRGPKVTGFPLLSQNFRFPNF